MRGISLRFLLIVISISTFAFWLSSSMLRPIFPLYLDYIGFSPFELGVVLTIPQLLSIFLRVPLARQAKKIGRIRFLMFAMLLNTLSIFLYFLFTSKPIIAMIRILHTLPIAAFGPVAMAYVSIITPENGRGGLMGLYLTSVGLSMFLGPLFTTVLTSFMDIQYTFLWAAIPSLMATILLISTLHGESTSVKSDASSLQESFLHGFKRLVNNWGFILICLAALLYSTSMGFMRAFLPLFLKEEYLIGASLISLLYSIRGLTNVLSRPLAGYLTDRIGVGILVVTGLLISSSVLFGLSFKPSLEIVALLLAIFGLAWGVRAVSSITFIGFYLNEEDREVGMAIFYNMFDIGVFIGAILTGYLLELLTYTDILYMLGGLVLVAALITLPLAIKRY